MEHGSEERGLTGYEWRARYSTSRDDLVTAFFKPAMERAAGYDRAVGFFRSSFYSVAGSTTANFALRGGRIRLLCSPELTRQDAEAIQRGLSIREAADRALQRELSHILEYPLSRAGVEILAALIAESALEVRFAVRDKSPGIFHDKVGIFRDSDGNAISFSGSVNETWQGWHPLGNHESFEVFLSWAAESSRVADHVDYFNALWDGEADGLTVIEAPRAFREQLLRYAPPREGGHYVRRPPSDRPAPRSLFDHQRDAIQAWIDAGRRGILEHATGSGKTLTALHAIRDWLALGRPAVVIVPSAILLDQWFDEASRELAALEPSILLAGAGHDEWRRTSLVALHTAPEGGPRLTIATVQTASAPAFISAVRGGDHLLFVADEVHRLGSERFRQVMTINSGPRLGLSATPERARDREGTDAIVSYFGPPLVPAFTLRDAIEAGRLTRYEYYVHLVSLSIEEADQYARLSAKIGKMMGANDGRMGGSSYLEHLLIQRARVVKQAEAKAPVAAEIVAQGQGEGSHWLVYCDTQAQLNDVLRRLRLAGVDAFAYHSEMAGDREATLDRFRRFGGTIVAIRCLDEGVDIPEISHAVILASSRNQREFIQRRGRVLRAHQGKRRAVIHDLLVAPTPGDRPGTYDSLLRAELARAREFAEDAVNVATRRLLDGLCIEWDIDPTEVGLEVNDEAEEGVSHDDREPSTSST